MTYDGWIKEYRKLLDNPLIKKPLHCHLWNILLLLAQHKKSQFIFADELWTLRPGQLKTGRKALSKLSGISERQCERILRYLEETAHQITQLKTNKFRIITIINWDKYQKDSVDVLPDTTREQQRAQQMAQQKNTYKNVKKDKNEKNKDYCAQFEQFWKVYPKKQGKGKAYESWCKINPSEQIIARMLDIIPAQAKADQWQKEGGKYIPMPVTWLNQKRWDDEPGHHTPTTSEQLNKIRKEEKLCEKKMQTNS